MILYFLTFLSISFRITIGDILTKCGFVQSWIFFQGREKDKGYWKQVLLEVFGDIKT